MVYFVMYAIATGDILGSLALRGALHTTTIMRMCQEESARRTIQFVTTRPDLGFRCERRSAASTAISPSSSSSR